jgi:SAM-dependent methyltransferase
MVRREFLKSKWDPVFDSKPTSDIPRMKFCETFSKQFFKKEYLALDVGCGTGSYTQIIDGENCVGMDLDINALKIAKQFCTKSNFVVASALNLPFRDNAFDIIFMWAVIEALPVDTEKQAITEVRRTLKLGAVFLLSAGKDHFITNIMDPGFYLRGQRHFDTNNLIKQIEHVGFSVKRHTTRGAWITLLSISIFYFYKYILHKKRGRLLGFFYKKSEKELKSHKHGFAIAFLAMQKI